MTVQINKKLNNLFIYSLFCYLICQDQLLRYDLSNDRRGLGGHEVELVDSSAIGGRQRARARDGQRASQRAHSA